MRVYFAGDTGRFRRHATPCRSGGPRPAAGLDVGPTPWTGASGPRSAAEVLRDIRPACAVPIHWGTLYPRRLHRIWKAPLLEPGERFGMHAAALAPTVDVRVLRPGEATAITLG